MYRNFTNHEKIKNTNFIYLTDEEWETEKNKIKGLRECLCLFSHLELNNNNN